MDKQTSENSKKDERPRLTVEELEKRVAPAVADKKGPVPPPYPPGTKYGLVRRENIAG